MFLPVPVRLADMENTADWMALGRNVVQARVSAGLRTSKSLAERMGVSQRLVGDIENGRRASYSSSTIASLEMALDWSPGSVDAVLAGRDPMPIGVLGSEQGGASEFEHLHRLGHDVLGQRTAQVLRSARRKYAKGERLTEGESQALDLFLTEKELETLPERIGQLDVEQQLEVSRIVDEWLEEPDAQSIYQLSGHPRELRLAELEYRMREASSVRAESVLIDEGSGAVSEEPAAVTRQDEVALAAMAGIPAYAERDETGEETQETGSDEPA